MQDANETLVRTNPPAAKLGSVAELQSHAAGGAQDLRAEAEAVAATRKYLQIPRFRPLRGLHVQREAVRGHGAHCERASSGNCGRLGDAHALPLVSRSIGSSGRGRRVGGSELPAIPLPPAVATASIAMGGARLATADPATRPIGIGAEPPRLGLVPAAVARDARRLIGVVRQRLHRWRHALSSRQGKGCKAFEKASPTRQGDKAWVL